MQRCVPPRSHHEPHKQLLPGQGAMGVDLMGVRSTHRSPWQPVPRDERAAVGIAWADPTLTPRSPSGGDPSARPTSLCRCTESDAHPTPRARRDEGYPKPPRQMLPQNTGQDSTLMTNTRAKTLIFQPTSSSRSKPLQM